ncbi:MAG: pitrilysin family protein [bacterium]|nr:insulinase family protein [bacterium]MBU1918674.1 insulinase family protein [bacterium]
MSQFSKKIKLTNGLTVIYEKVDTADVVSIYLGVRLGSSHEKDQEAGMSHLIEHMVFKGTSSYKAGEIATLVEAHGGELNAYTSWDQTVYYINLPCKHFEVGLKIIKEMAFDANIDPIELEREKEVIIEEIRRSQDSPTRILSETLFKYFYKKHTYGRPIIGTKKLIRGYSPEEVKTFYKKHYTPQNMVLAICGNISQTHLSHSLENNFRYAVRSTLKTPHIPKEPEKKTYHVSLQKMDIQATYLELGFPAPELTHKDVPAMDILSHLLGESETSLLEQNTKEKEQLVHNLYSSCYTPKHPGVFIISALLDPRNMNKAIKSIRDQVEYVKKIPFEIERIERSKLLSRAQLVYERQTCEGTAKKWITYEIMANNYRFDEEYIERINQLTAEDLQNVAKKYLDFSKVTVAVLHPENKKVTIDKTLFKKENNTKKNVYKKTRQIKDTKLFTLDNGIRVIIKENHRLPLVSLKTASLGGVRYETKNNNGVNHLLSNIMTRSTLNYNQELLSEKCEWLGGNVQGYTGRNSIGVSFSFLSEKLHHALPVFGDIILNPLFDNDEIKKEKKLMLEGIKNRSDNPAQVAFRSLLNKLFQSHPYSLHLLGERKSVQSLSATTLKNYHQKIFVPKNLVVSVVGDVDTYEMLDLLNQNLSELKNKDFSKRKLNKPLLPKKQEILFHNKAREQAHIAIGFLSTSIYDDDKFAMEILSSLLSGQGGRLFLELRDKQSLAYSVSTILTEGIETGFFSSYIATEPAKVTKAIDGMFLELDKLKKTRISQEELERTKNYIIGNQEIENQKNSSIAMQMALNEIYGQGINEWYDYAKNIRKVSAKDIQRVAEKYIKPNKCVMSIVGPKKYAFTK